MTWLPVVGSVKLEVVGGEFCFLSEKAGINPESIGMPAAGRNSMSFKHIQKSYL